MRYQVAYLNVYGNAKILADAIMDLLPSDSTECIDLSCQELYDDADVYLMIFEMMRSAIPLDIMDALENLGGKSILCFAACGSELWGDKEHIEQSMFPFLPDECDYRGLFVCPGHVPVNILDSMQQSLQEQPENSRAMAILEDYRRSSGHPDAEDMNDLRRFISEHISLEEV